jgi:glucose-6-phosphate isomerase
LLGTRQALYDNNRDSITVTIPQVNARTVGALIALYERTVGFYASLVNINAYHQPGVEAGKKAAAAILDLQQKVIKVLQTEKKALSISEIADKAGAAEQVESIYKILRHLHANNRGVLLTGDLGKPGTLTVSLG